MAGINIFLLFFIFISSAQATELSDHEFLRRQVEHFREEIHAQYNSVPGELAKRISGEFSFISNSGKMIRIGFIGLTHETFKGETSPGEKIFFKTHFNEGKPVLVEQGASTSNNRLEKSFLDFARQHPVMKFTVLKATRDLDHSPYGLAQYLSPPLAMNVSSQNIDLVANPMSLNYLLLKKGIVDTIKWLLINLAVFRVPTEEVENISNSIIKTQRLTDQFNPVVISELSKTYYPQIKTDPSFGILERYRIVSHLERDEFMAMQIMNFDQDATLLAATPHILGILEHLKYKLISFNLKDIELAPFALENVRKNLILNCNQSLNRLMPNNKTFY
jgi:hypothetical protein